MSVIERVSKRPKITSVVLTDLPKPDTGLATKANKNNTVNAKMDIENIYQSMNANIQIIIQDEKQNNNKTLVRKIKLKG